MRCGHLFTIKLGVKGLLHKPCSEETKRKIGLANSIKNLGHKHTEESKLKIVFQLKKRRAK